MSNHPPITRPDPGDMPSHKWTQLDCTIIALGRFAYRRSLDAAAQSVGCELMGWFPDLQDTRDEVGARIEATVTAEFCVDVKLDGDDTPDDFRSKLAAQLRQLAAAVEEIK